MVNGRFETKITQNLRFFENLFHPLKIIGHSIFLACPSPIHAKMSYRQKKLYFRSNNPREYIKIFKISPFRGRSDKYFGSYGRFQNR